ncbi:hypothetical protein GF318_03430 [Candidatus Micrarchaeota archaeon]|nr:hypothetical protein [Candidatus Micrarchaeota archaeon]
MKRLQSPRARAGKPGIKKRLAAIAFSGLTALTAPQFEGIAAAEQAIEAEPRLAVRGASTVMEQGEESREVYIVSRQLGHFPELEVEGPASLTITFHPAVLREWFDEGNPEVSRTVRYRMENGEEGREQVFSGETSLSEAVSPDIPGYIADESGEERLNPLAIGTSIEETIEIPEGRHTIRLVSPNGLAEFRAEPLAMEAEPEEPVAGEPEEPAEQEEPAPAEQPEPGVGQEEPEERRLSFLIDGYRHSIHNAGSWDIAGDLNSITAFADVGIGEHAGIFTGLAFSSYGLSLDSELIEGNVRTYGGTFMAGPSFASGRHRVHVAGTVGYNGVFLDAGQGDVSNHLFEYGGQFGYSFGNLVRIRITGSSNTVMPLSAGIYGRLPVGWADGANPWAQLDVFYLQLPSPAETERGDGVLIDEDNVHARLTLGIPVWAINAGRATIIPTVLVAGNLDASGEEVNNLDFQLGGSIEASVSGFGIGAAGGASPLTAEPFFLFRAGYSR